MGKQDDLKRAAAEAAYEYVNDGEYLGVGTGSTVNHFIDVLAEREPDIPGCVSSSKAGNILGPNTPRGMVDPALE